VYYKYVLATLGVAEFPKVMKLLTSAATSRWLVAKRVSLLRSSAFSTSVTSGSFSMAAASAAWSHPAIEFKGLRWFQV